MCAINPCSQQSLYGNRPDFPRAYGPSRGFRFILSAYVWPFRPKIHPGGPRRLVGVELEDMPWFAPTFNAAPQSVQPVVRLNRDSGNREVALMRWGLVPFWAKDAKIAYTTINARAEEAAANQPIAKP